MILRNLSEYSESAKRVPSIPSTASLPPPAKREKESEREREREHVRKRVFVPHDVNKKKSATQVSATTSVV